MNEGFTTRRGEVSTRLIRTTATTQNSADGDLSPSQLRLRGTLRGGQVRVVCECVGELRCELLRGLLENLRAGADRQVPHRDEHAVRAEHADQAATLDARVGTLGVQLDSRIEQRDPVPIGHTSLGERGGAYGRQPGE